MYNKSVPIWLIPKSVRSLRERSRKQKIQIKQLRTIPTMALQNIETRHTCFLDFCVCSSCPARYSVYHATLPCRDRKKTHDANTSDFLSDSLSFWHISDIHSGILSDIRSEFWGWGLAENTGRGCSRLRTGREHWTWLLAVEAKEEEEAKEKEEKEKTTNIKSKNPHVTGGEPTKAPTTQEDPLVGWNLKRGAHYTEFLLEGCNYRPWSSGNPWTPLKKGNNKQLVWRRNIRIQPKKEEFLFLPVVGGFNQPIWKMRKSNWIISLIFEVKIKKMAWVATNQLSFEIFQPQKSSRGVPRCLMCCDVYDAIAQPCSPCS